VLAALRRARFKCEKCTINRFKPTAITDLIRSPPGGSKEGVMVQYSHITCREEEEIHLIILWM
jgi:hypothetical protein